MIAKTALVILASLLAGCSTTVHVKAESGPGTKTSRAEATVMINGSVKGRAALADRSSGNDAPARKATTTVRAVQKPKLETVEIETTTERKVKTEVATDSELKR